MINSVGADTHCSASWQIVQMVQQQWTVGALGLGLYIYWIPGVCPGWSDTLLVLTQSWRLACSLLPWVSHPILQSNRPD
jgi:hypothetical protein